MIEMACEPKEKREARRFIIEPEERDAYDPPCGLFRRADNG